MNGNSSDEESKTLNPLDMTNQLPLSDLLNNSGVTSSTTTTTTTTSSTTTSTTTVSSQLETLTTLITDTPNPSTDLMRVLNDRIKFINTTTLELLQSKSDEVFFKKWLRKVDNLLSRCGLESLTLLPKGESPQSMSYYRKYSSMIRKNYHAQFEELSTKIKDSFRIDPMRIRKYLESSDTTRIILNEIIFLVTLDAYFGIEEVLFTKIKTSAPYYENILPDKFFSGALRMTYFALQNEFFRPHASQLFQRQQNFFAQGRFVLKHDEDPRGIFDAISREMDLVNTIGKDEIIRDRDATMALRQAAMSVPSYAAVIKSLENERKTISFSLLKSKIEQEFMNYGNGNTVQANFASQSQRVPQTAAASKFSTLSEPLTQTVDNHRSQSESVYYVKHVIPKGFCFEFYRTGRCSRSNCDFKHVESDDHSENTEGTSKHHSKRERGTRNHNRDYNRFSTTKRTFGKGKLNKAFKATLNALSDSDSTDESSDSVSTDDDQEEALIAALQALAVSSKKKKYRHFKKGNRKGKRDRSSHPNQQPFLDKIKQLTSKDKKNKQDKKKLQAQVASLLSLHPNLILADSDLEPAPSDSEEKSE